MKESTLTEFVKSSSDEEIGFLNTKLTERLQDDLADVFDFLSRGHAKYHNIDGLFRATNSAYELYDLCDSLQSVVRSEAEKRKIRR